MAYYDSDGHEMDEEAEGANNEEKIKKEFERVQKMAIEFVLENREDYYTILGVGVNFKELELRKAYKKLALQFHPDKNKSVGADEAFKAISRAFEVLGNYVERARYDKKMTKGSENDMKKSDEKEVYQNKKSEEELEKYTSEEEEEEEEGEEEGESGEEEEPRNLRNRRNRREKAEDYREEPQPQKTIEMITLPNSYQNADKSDLIELIHQVLEKAIKYNDPISIKTKSLTRFHSQKPPDISVRNYLERIVKYTALEPVCLLMILVYADRISERETHTSFMLCSLTIHRFLIAAITVSSKALCDVYCTNSHYAKVGGISTRELGILEMALIESLGWSLIAKGSLVNIYYSSLVDNHQNYTLESKQPEKHLIDSKIDSSIDNDRIKRVALGTS
ncbi:hypothetical protein BB559_003947 [Furculomyces boomerangus]|uniref:J domain-containing protein n=1 Tax=Furculomyces boomerangus TaxID=61424 RepID=A0A2T9YHX4_9FUNG|nr:hypothetical protein BB559_003947 [Furculomyces boomerangus]